ncbi:cyclic nucleotide-gated ion channel [Rhodoligotrophos defluvii]|uniref:cyclic nucleotide-gated ion channel n=1 Tax=Rhodoligotrophos defluvii TaxID=2561934 RepID=UPI0010C976B1|nr:cyclic nucleotide-gated ion channel [Rhodoligotrophos defluvii]
MAAGPAWLRSLRRSAFDLLEGGRRAGPAPRAFNLFLIILIIANVSAAVIETVPAIAASYGEAFNAFDTLCVTIFLVEYIARLWTAREHPMVRHLSPWKARLRFAASPLMMIDLIAILPFFLQIIFPADLSILRVLRFIRFFRLTRYSTAMATIGRVLSAERHSLFAAAVLMMSAMLVSSMAMYLAERNVQPDKFGDVPSAMWWAIVTLATVGYGDVVPISPLGKVIGGITVVVGLGLFALPVGIIATGFQDEIRRRNFVVSYGMVARVPVFAELDAADIAEVVRMLSARSVPPGTVIIRKGEIADCMYFIASGTVAVQLDGKAIELGPGDFFGEIALLGRRVRSATIRAVTACEFLVLDAADLDRLLAKNPSLAEAFHATARARLGETFDPIEGG